MSNRERIYEHAHASLLKLASDFATGFGVTAVNLDAYADAESLPAGDLVGVDGLSMMEKDPTEGIAFNISVLTENDSNNMKLSQRISVVFDRLRWEKDFPLVHCETGEVMGSIKIVGPGQVLPVTRVSATRSMQMMSTVGALIYEQAS